MKRVLWKRNGHFQQLSTGANSLDKVAGFWENSNVFLLHLLDDDSRYTQFKFGCVHVNDASNDDTNQRQLCRDVSGTVMVGVAAGHNVLARDGATGRRDAWLRFPEHQARLH